MAESTVIAVHTTRWAVTIRGRVGKATDAEYGPKDVGSWLAANNNASDTDARISSHGCR